MVQVNLALREINCKLVYFGPGLSGKTTNLEIVHERAPESSKGQLTSIATESDRTLFFDFMPLNLGKVSGMQTKFQLYTVPGQVYYNSTRKLVLRGADGVVFVADSQADKMEENIESLDNLEECLREQGRSLSEMPHVIQWNKRDLPEVMEPAEMDDLLNRHGVPCFEAVANTGDGVIETFKALSGLVLEKVKGMTETRATSASPVSEGVGSQQRGAGSGGLPRQVPAGAGSPVAEATPAAVATPVAISVASKPAARATVEPIGVDPTPRMPRERASGSSSQRSIVVSSRTGANPVRSPGFWALVLAAGVGAVVLAVAKGFF